MKNCKQCGKPLDDSFSVCPYCGAPAVQEAFAPAPGEPYAGQPGEPYAPYPYPAQPYEAYAPAAPAPGGTTKPLILGIVGLACGIFSLTVSLVAVLAGLALGAHGGVGGFIGVVYGIVAFVAGIPGLVCSILGKRAAASYENAGGAPSGKVRTGRKLASSGFGISIAGLALSAVAIVFGVLAWGSGVTYYRWFD